MNWPTSTRRAYGHQTELGRKAVEVVAEAVAAAAVTFAEAVAAIDHLRQQADVVVARGQERDGRAEFLDPLELGRPRGAVGRHGRGRGSQDDGDRSECRAP